MASGILSSSSPYLYNAAAIFGAFPLLAGIAGLVNPEIGLQIFKFDAPVAIEGKKLALNLMTLWATRDVFMGAVTIAAWYHGNRKTLGWIMVAGFGVVVGDGIVSLRQIGKGEWSHWGFAPMMLGVGAGLLGVFDKL